MFWFCWWFFKILIQVFFKCTLWHNFKTYSTKNYTVKITQVFFYKFELCSFSRGKDAWSSLFYILPCLQVLNLHCAMCSFWCMLWKEVFLSYRNVAWTCFLVSVLVSSEQDERSPPRAALETWTCPFKKIKQLWFRMNLLQLKAAESQLNPSFPKNKFSINVVADCGLEYKLTVKRFEIQNC